MSPAAWWLLAAVALSAAVDWAAVGSGRRRLEHVAKPLTTVLLITLALAIEPADPAQRWWFVAALVASLAGDAALMVDRLLPGLSAFLVAHLLYIAGFTTRGVSTALVAVGAVAVLLVAVPVGARVVSALRGAERGVLVGPVTAYVVVISAMVAVATGTGTLTAIAGAWAFCLSDALIGWERFVRTRTWTPVAIMVTYHLAQALLVTSLAA